MRHIRACDWWCAESRESSRCLFQQVNWWPSIYDKNFYVAVQILCYWRYYLLPQEFVLYSNHKTLKYLNSQKSLNARHNKWVKFFQDYTFVLRHKARVEKKVADVLSRRVMILVAMSAEVTGFERLREKYESCPDFGETYVTLWDN